MSGNNDHRFNRCLGLDTVADVRKHLSLPHGIASRVGAPPWMNGNTVNGDDQVSFTESRGLNRSVCKAPDDPEALSLQKTPSGASNPSFSMIQRA